MIPRHLSSPAVARRPARIISVARPVVCPPPQQQRQRARRSVAAIVVAAASSSSSTTTTTTPTPQAAAPPRVRAVPVAAIRRPLGKTRANDQQKVAALMASIEDAGLLEPIDVLEVDGVIYGFSGCHRYEAHVRLGKETILCRVRKATRGTLMMHLR